MKLWILYLFKKLIKTFLFFLISFFLIYTIVDLSVHGAHLIIQKDTLEHIFFYYLQNFSKYLTLFFPLTFLLASLKILIECNTHHELTALSMAGLSHTQLLKPFFTLAFILTMIAYANYEWIIPNALQSMETFQNKILFKKSKTQPSNLHKIVLKDGSELIYQQFAFEKNELFDVFWIKSSEEIWHSKYLLLSSTTEVPVFGLFSDHFKRSQNGLFEKIAHFEKTSFPEIEFNEDDSHQELRPFEQRSITTLMRQALTLKIDKHPVLSHLQYKIATTLLPPFILYLISPIAMRFQRSKSMFLIVALSLFSFIGFMTILEGMLILGENQVIPSLIAIWSPFVLCLIVHRFFISQKSS